MGLIRKPLGLLVFVFSILSTSGFAQYVHSVAPFLSNFRNKYRYEIGGNAILPMGEYTGVVRVLGPNNYYLGDSTATRSLSGDPGFGIDLGLSLPFKGTGHISNWAASMHLWVNQYMWKNLNQTMSSGGTYVNASVPVNATTMQIALPVGIEWKVGNDAILSKRLTFGASLGAGVIPQVNLTKLEGVEYIDPGMGFGLTPYAKGEVAVFTGFCWKLRFMYTAGNANLLDVNRRLNANLTDGPFTIRSTGNAVISLIIMPWSVGWKEFDWWNTYDTYNQHDRFN